jgi:hypothetical protein
MDGIYSYADGHAVVFVLLATGPLNQRGDAASGPADPASGLKTSCRGYPSAGPTVSSSWRYVGNDVPLRTDCAPCTAPELAVGIVTCGLAG